MICVISAASQTGGPAGRAVFENVTPPPVSVSSPAARPVLIFTPPLTPAAPSWMWPMLIFVVDGHPLMTMSNFTDVGFRVTVAVPAQVASGPVIGGGFFRALTGRFYTVSALGARA